MSTQKAQQSKKNTPSSKGTQKKKKTKKGKPIQFHLTWSGLISWGVFAFVLVAWAFILGVFVGRGYQPEAFLPLVADYMPGQSKQQDDQDQNQNPILSAQELGFFESLQSAPGLTPQEKKQKASKNRASPETKPETGMKAQKSDTSYVYEFQVGAFKRQDQADALRQRLAQKEFSAAVQQSRVQGSAWYRVVVRHTAGPAEVKAFTARLQQAGVSNFFLRSKKPK
ncbi:MAG: SPOR domain-containing protein [Desulfovermiculus sp.]